MNITKRELVLKQLLANIEKASSINLDDINPDVLPADIKPTKVFNDIFHRLNYAIKMQAPLMAIAGANGAGKTLTAKVYASLKNIQMTEVVTGMQHKHMLNALCRQMGIDIGTGWMMQVDMIVSHLKNSPRVMILDEAQRLGYESFDLLKYLADHSGSTFVLIGSASMLTRIERWPDIDARCPVKLKVETMEKTEFVRLYEPDGYTADTLSEIHTQSKGIMRNVGYLMTHIEEELKRSRITKKEIMPAHIRQLADKFF